MAKKAKKAETTIVAVIEKSKLFHEIALEAAKIAYSKSGGNYNINATLADEIIKTDEIDQIVVELLHNYWSALDTIERLKSSQAFIKAFGSTSNL